MQPGDVVTLKSGGPAMTVKWVEEGHAYCEWFSKGELKGSKFALSSIEEQNNVWDE